MAAAKQNGLALEFAGAALRSNRELVLAAAKQNGLALEFAGAALRSNREVVVAAAKRMALRSSLQASPPRGAGGMRRACQGEREEEDEDEERCGTPRTAARLRPAPP